MCPRARPPNASPSRRGRSSPASRRAASSTSCPPSTTTPPPRSPQRLSERAEGHITVEDVRAASDHRAVGQHGPRVPRSRRARGLRADPARAQGRYEPRSGVRLPSGRRIDRGLRAAAQAPACGHPGVRPRAGRGLHRGARRRVRAQADGVGRQGPLHPGRLVTGRSPGLRLRGGPQAQRVRRPLRRADRHRARRRGGAADQGGDPRPLGPLRPVRRSAPSTSRSRRSRTSSSSSSTTRVRCASCWTPSRRPVCDIPGGIIEHQRTSYLDNRALDTANIEPYDGHVALYMADRYHDDAIMFEPRYAIRQPDGGWGEFAVGPGDRADRGRAHPGDRRTVHCQGGRSHERGDQPYRRRGERRAK